MPLCGRCRANRWTGAAAGLFMQLSGGTAYAWGAYSGHVKAVMGLDQRQLNIMSSVGNIGMYVGIIAGIVYDKLPKTWGPQVVNVIGASLTLFGYLLLWAVARTSVAKVLGPSGSVVVLAPLLAFTWNGSTWLDASSMAATMQNFAPDKGLIVGVLKSFFGLAATVISVMYVAFFDEGQVLYKADSCPEFVLVALVFSSASFVVLPMVYVDSSKSRVLPLTQRGKLQVYGLYAAITGLAIFLIVVSVMEGRWKEEKTGAPSNGTQGAAGLRVGSRPLLEYAFVAVEVVAILALLTLPLGMRAEDERAGFASPAAQRTRAGLVPTLSAALLDGEEEGAAVTAHTTKSTLSLASLERGFDGAERSAERSASMDSADAYSDNTDAQGKGNGGRRDSHSFSTTDYFNAPGGGESAPSVATEGGEAAALVPQTPLTEQERCLQGKHRNASVCFALSSIDFWLLFGGMFCVMGSALMTINNISQMVAALGATNGALFVSLLGISNCLGRMIGGLAANTTRECVARTWWLALFCLTMACAQLLIVAGSLPLLYPAAVLTGMAYGACWSTTPPLASDIFGNANFAGIYQCLGLAPAFGSIVCSIGIAGTLYDQYATSGADGVSTCIGAHCFRYTCIVTASLSALGATLIAILAIRMQRFYFPKRVTAST